MYNQCWFSAFAMQSLGYYLLFSIPYAKCLPEAM